MSLTLATDADDDGACGTAFRRASGPHSPGQTARGRRNGLEDGHPDRLTRHDGMTSWFPCPRGMINAFLDLDAGVRFRKSVVVSSRPWHADQRGPCVSPLVRKCRCAGQALNETALSWVGCFCLGVVWGSPLSELGFAFCGSREPAVGRCATACLLCGSTECTSYSMVSPPRASLIGLDSTDRR